MLSMKTTGNCKQASRAGSVAIAGASEWRNKVLVKSVAGTANNREKSIVQQIHFLIIIKREKLI